MDRGRKLSREELKKYLNENPQMSTFSYKFGSLNVDNIGSWSQFYQCLKNLNTIFSA
jgi:hypothetical protein